MKGLRRFVFRLLYVNVVLYTFLRLFKSKDLNEHMKQHGVFRDSIACAVFSELLESRYGKTGHRLKLVDVGANYGLFFRQTKFFKKQEVIAFEPNKSLHIDYGPFFNWSDKGISDRAGCFEFYIDKNHTGASSLLKTPNHTEAVSVDVCTLDDFFTANLDTVSAVKIDVEGSELNVLEGAKKLIEESSPFVVVESQSSKLSEISRLMPGYVFYEMSAPGVDHDPSIISRSFGLVRLLLNKKVELRSLNMSENSDRYIDNILCIPKGVGLPKALKISI